MTKHKLALELALCGAPVGKETSNNYLLLLFTKNSWTTFPVLLERGKTSKLSKVFDLQSDDFVVIQLYVKERTGLGKRHSQRMVGATSLSIVASKNSKPFTCPLARTDYFRSSQEATANCWISAPTLRFTEFKNKYKNYHAKKHIGTVRYKPASKFIANVYMPYYFDESLQSRIPGPLFMQFPLFREVTPIYDWIKQIRKVVSRFGKEPRVTLKTTIEEILAEFDCAKPNLERSLRPSLRRSLQPIHLLADVLNDVVTAYPYRGDRSESFDDVFFNRGGDCEDFAKGILRVWAEMKRTAEQNLNTNLFRSIHAIMVQYTPFAALGSVLKRSFSAQDHQMTKSGEAGHMFVVLLPNDQMRSYMGTGGPRTGKLPLVICEGTARVSYLASSVMPEVSAGPNFDVEVAYPLQPMSPDSFRLTQFYHRIVFMVSGERDVFKKHGTSSFLMVNESRNEYGVKIDDLNRGEGEGQLADIKMLPERPYCSKMLRYVEQVYLPMQAHYMRGIPRLPLDIGIHNVLHEDMIGLGKWQPQRLFFIDKSDWNSPVLLKAMKQGVKRVVKECPGTICLQF